MFLKLLHYPSIRSQDLFIGSTVTVCVLFFMYTYNVFTTGMFRYSRQLNIVDYANEATRRLFQKTRGRWVVCTVLLCLAFFMRNFIVL